MATSGEGSGVIHVHVEDGRSQRSANRLRPTLSPRQDEVLRMRATGMTNYEVAQELGVSQQTIKNVMYATFRRLDVTHLVQAMHVMGWVEIR